MTIRRARRSEHMAMAEVCRAAFFEEDLFGRVMHPRRHEYPNDPALWWYSHIRGEWANWTNHTFVKVVKDEKDGKEKIVGIAIWQRQGDGGQKMEPSILDPRRLLTPYTHLTNHLSTYIYPNRALDPSKTHLLASSLPFSAHHWSAPSRRENWYLNLLAVSPSHQGCGYGQELVQWGIEQADHEGICASVMSSDGKEKFYLKSGFDEIVGNATEGEGNPLRGVSGGAILFRWARKGGSGADGEESEREKGGVGNGKSGAN